MPLIFLVELQSIAKICVCSEETNSAHSKEPCVKNVLFFQGPAHMEGLAVETSERANPVGN